MTYKTRILNGFLALVLLLALPAFAAPEVRTFVPVQDGFSALGEDYSAFVAGRVLIKFTPQAASSAPLNRVALEKGAMIADLKTGLAAVEIAQPDWRAFPAAVPNDTFYPDSWGHNNTAQTISYDWSTNSQTGPTVGTVGFDANAKMA